MHCEIVPFAPQHAEPAAALLAARHRVDRGRAPELPLRFEDAGETLGVLRALLDAGASGVVALRSDRLVGFLIGEPVLVPPTDWRAQFHRPRSADVPYAAHAVDSTEGADLARDLYAALAPCWVGAGLYAHYVGVPAADREAEEGWISLGFGRQFTIAVRSADPGPELAGAVGGAVAIRRAGPGDLDAVMNLIEALWRYHAGPPIYTPMPPETAADRRAYNERMLADPANAYWLAERDGRPVAVHTYEAPTGFPSPLAIPDRAVLLLQAYTVPEVCGGGVGRALLRHGLTHARDHGAAQCLVPFAAANSAGPRFWLAHGFRPVLHGLCRVVDERIAWAGG